MSRYRNFMYPILLITGLSFFGSLVAEQDPYARLLSERYSSYAFDPAHRVTREQLETVLAAARLTPSSYNEQPWNFIVCDKNTDLPAFEKALSTLVEFNQGWARNASALIISVAGSTSGESGKENLWAQYDTGAATFSMMLQATSLGLAAHQMGGFDSDRVKKLFCIPDNFTPMSVLAIGSATGSDVRSERKRKPPSENFFYGGWNSKECKESAKP